MVLKQLVLRNFRRFRHLDLEFPENLQGFVGQNGTGKSTIVEAVAWALYGTYATRGAKSEIRTHGVSQREICEVELVFEISGTEYKIQRKLRGKNAAVEAAIYAGGGTDPLAVQDRGVNEYVASIVGLDYRSFFASVFARQKDLAALGEMRPEERRMAINRLINIDAIDRARKLAMETRTAAENKLRGMESMLKNTDELERNIAELAASVKHEEAAVALARRSVETAGKAFEKTRKRYSELSRIRDTFLQIEADIGKCTSEKSAVDRQLSERTSELKKIENNEKILNAMERDRRRYLEVKVEKERLEKLQIQSQRLETCREELNYQEQQIEAEQIIILRLQKEIAAAPDPDTAFDGVEASQETLRQTASNLREQQNKLLEQIGAIASKGKEAKQRRESIGTLGPESPCPVCTRPLGEHYETVVGHLDREIEQLREEYKAADRERKIVEEKLGLNEHAQKSLQQQREKLTETITLVRRKRQELKEAQARQGGFREKAKQIKVQMTDLGEVDYSKKQYLTVIAEYEKLHERHEEAIRLEAAVARKPEVKKEIATIDARRKALTAAIESHLEAREALAYDENQYAEAKKQYEDEMEKLNRLRSTLAETEKALIAAQTNYRHAEDALKLARQQLEEVARLKQEKQYYDALVYHFGRFRLHLASRLQPLIAARSSELLRLTTSGRYALLELDEDYNIHIVDQGTTFPLQRFSGGEQDLANLCLRIAISQVVAERSGKTPVQFIVLDEVFGSQDAQRQNLILHALHQLQSQFRQIFLISHVEVIKEILPVIIQVEMISAGESRAYIV